MELTIEPLVGGLVKITSLVDPNIIVNYVIEKIIPGKGIVAKTLDPDKEIKTRVLVKNPYGIWQVRNLTTSHRVEFFMQRILTGEKELDRVILSYVPEAELIHACDTNIYVQDICQEETLLPPKMTQVQLLAFPVGTVSNPFNVKYLQSPECLIDWTSRNSLILSQTLNCQVINNYNDFWKLINKCKNPSQQERLGLLNISQERCAQFRKRQKGYQDTFNRDHHLFNQSDWNVITYSIVLLYRGKYFGHIYTWISPRYPSMCLAMGIRGRVDNVFLEDTLPNVANYLLEGVRRFALAKGCYFMVITKPLAVMKTVLLRLGFKQTYVSVAGVGISLTYPDLPGINIDCDDCYQSELTKSFTEEVPVEFELIE